MSPESLDELSELASLIKKRNLIAKSITKKIGKPAFLGNIGEYVAARIFGIKLEESSTQKGIDGRFKWGALKGNTVNVKMYTKPKVVDFNHSSPPDFYLVLSGPRTGSKGFLPWCIHHVYLIEYRELKRYFVKHNRELKREMSMKKELWEQAEIYPNNRNRRTVLSSRQREMLELFDD